MSKVSGNFWIVVLEIYPRIIYIQHSTSTQFSLKCIEYNITWCKGGVQIFWF